MPKTPPESPAVFHYSLPSPGLVSPLALFESLEEQRADDKGVRKVWVEQVDFRLAKKQEDEQVAAMSKAQEFARRRGHGRLPSLEQITERYGSHVATAPMTQPARNRIPLPAFLNARRQSPSPPPEQKLSQLPIGTGRLRFPSRFSPPSSETESDTDSSVSDSEGTVKAVPAPLPASLSPRQRTYALPSSPMSPQPPALKLQVTTTLIPRTSSASPVKLTEANLQALNSRARTGRDMISVIRRRTTVYSGNVAFPFSPSSRADDAEKCRRRNSAPAELPRRERNGFMHPVLRLPGGF